MPLDEFIYEGKKPKQTITIKCTKTKGTRTTPSKTTLKMTTLFPHLTPHEKEACRIAIEEMIKK